MALPHEGKVALVTGSSRGIGKAIALQLAADGADVVVCARSEQGTEMLPGSIGETASQIEVLGRKALALRMDVANDDDLRDGVDRVLSEWGKIDILVNNAGSAMGGAFLDATLEAFEASFRLNVRAPFLLSQLVAPGMINRGGGIIVNISSGAGRMQAPPSDSPPQPSTGGGGGGGAAGGPIYGMTKAALDRFATGIARELWDQQVAVINFNPGFTLTERMVASGRRYDPARVEKPETTAKAVSFVCQDPLPYSGRLLNAREVADKNGLAG